ncbi:MAG: PDZ domain-containing protein [Planctomycetota bacterium]
MKKILLRTTAVVLLGSLAFPHRLSRPQEETEPPPPPPAEAETVAEAAPAPPPSELRSTEEAKKVEKRRRRPVEGTLPIEWADQIRWRSIGPANMGGRIVDIAVHPTDSTCYWIATASGGLLKTTNNGLTYRHQFDHEATVSVGAVAVSESNPDIVWVGTGEANPRNSVSWGDGVYASMDGGATWGHKGLPGSFQVGAVVIHPTNPDIVYVGALGRLWGPNAERGLFKTTDGGGSWTRILHLDANTGVVDVQMHPEDPETLLVATYERRRDEFDSNDPRVKWGAGAGIYKTTDGGANFRRITAGLPSVRMGRIGLDYCLSDPNIVYAIVETERISQEPENAAYMGVRGEDAEVGVRLTAITKDGPGAKANLKEGDILVTIEGELVHSWGGLLKIMRRHVADETVHLVLSRERQTVEADLTFERRPSEREDAPRAEGEMEGEESTATRAEGGPKEEAAPPAVAGGRKPIEVEKPDFPSPGPFSGGLGGQRENAQDDQGREGHEFGGVYLSADGGESWTRVNSVNPRPMYYSQVRVDPSDANRVYVLGTSLYRSADGGRTFTDDGHGEEVHVDHHALWIDPADGRHMILGNDGGLYVTWDRMETWDHHNHVAIGQFYDIAVDGERDYRVHGGLQDNGSWGGPSRGGDGRGAVNTDWLGLGGGDGFVCFVDAEDPDLVYYESQNGGMGRTHLRTGEGGYMRPRGERGYRYRFDWKTPFLLSQHNPRIFYCAGNYVFRSLDRGQNMHRISPEISRTDRGAATALAESPRNHDELYVGTDDGALWATANGGVEWRDLFALNEVEEKEGTGEAADAAVITETTAPLPGEGAADEAGADRVSGEWKAQAAGEDIADPAEGAFLLTLRLAADGTVTGHVVSPLGEGDVSEGRFDPATGALSFTAGNDEMRVVFAATVTGEAMEGSVVGPADSFRYSFTARREPPAAAAPAAETPAPAEGAAPAPERKRIENTIDQLLPGRYRPSALVASQHADGRVYAVFDGHYFDDDAPHLYASEDRGTTWKSIRGNLPNEAGSARVLVEDAVNPDLLFLGTEFGAFATIDRGESWTQLRGDLPTVAVHDFAVHVPSGELVAGTHGRSIWIADISALRQMNAEKVAAAVELYDPHDAVLWQRQHSRGAAGTRVFVGDTPPAGVQIYYSLGKTAKDLELTITRPSGEVLQTLEASSEKGLHRVNWDLRTARTDERGRSRRGRRAEPGTYVVVLRAGGAVLKQEFTVQIDPNAEDARYLEYEAEREAREAELNAGARPSRRDG